jgi:hypothetical protein
MNPAQRRRHLGRNRRRAELAERVRYPLHIVLVGEGQMPTGLHVDGKAVVFPPGSDIEIVPVSSRAARAGGVAPPPPPSTLTDADRAECRAIARRLRVEKASDLKRTPGKRYVCKGWVWGDSLAMARQLSAERHNAEYAEKVRDRAAARPRPAPKTFTGPNIFPKKAQPSAEMPVRLRARGGDEKKTQRNRAKARRRWLRSVA